jgi:hypothetical protein
VLTVPSRAASWNPLIVIVALMALPLTVPDNGPPGKQIELKRGGHRSKGTSGNRTPVPGPVSSQSRLTNRNGEVHWSRYGAKSGRIECRHAPFVSVSIGERGRYNGCCGNIRRSRVPSHRVNDYNGVTGCAR